MASGQFVRRFAGVTLSFLFVFLNAVAALAAYPDHPIELVAWASPGGGSDIMTRTFAEAAKGIIPQSIYVVNRPGGGGAVGMAYVANKPADGYTLLGVTNNLIFTPLTSPKVQYTYRDFAPIIAFGIDAKVIAVNARSRYGSVKDLVEDARTRPNRVRVATFGVGTDDHITAYMLGRAAGVQFQIVPFSGGGEQLTALLGGHVDAMVTEMVEVFSQIEAGNVRLLASATEQRLSGMPEVPTLKELGYDVVIPKFRGIVVKSGTPQPIVEYLIEASRRVVRTELFQRYLKENFIEPAEITGRDFERMLAEQEVTFGRILKELGVSP